MAKASKEYLNTLDPLVSCRYHDKISVIGGIDPFSILEKDLGIEFDLLLQVSYGDLWQYLVLTASWYTNDQFKAFKSLDAYKFHVDGWVKSMRVGLILDHCVVLGTVRRGRDNLKKEPIWNFS